jgi:MoaA/NifB/PqqE/SkfB family radical SAM enzyme
LDIVEPEHLEEKAKTFSREKVGIVITAYDYLLNIAYKQVISAGFSSIFFLNEYYKHYIPEKMQPRDPKNFFLEVSLSDHCNLNCQMCDHFSPIATENFLDFNIYLRDIIRLAELSKSSIEVIKLLGGEPLLHEDIPSFLVATRAIFPSSIILLYTNGLLLHEWETKKKTNLWQLCKLLSIRIMVTTYPINFDYKSIDIIAEKYGVLYNRFVEESDNFQNMNEILYNGTLDKVKQSVHHPFALNKETFDYEFIDCYHFNKCITLREGKLYPCPIIPHSVYFSTFFNKDLIIAKDDSIDIYAVQNFSEISEFLSRNVPFCRYCSVSKRKGNFDFKTSQKKIEEWLLIEDSKKTAEGRLYE